MKIAWFTPFHRRSAIGNYSAIICDELRRGHEVTVYASDLADGEDTWRPSWPVVHLQTADRAQVLRDLAGFQLVVYNMGDSSYHNLVYDYLQLYPGIVVLHDLVIRHFFIAYILQNDPQGETELLDALLDLMEKCHGKSARAWLLSVLESGYKDYWTNKNLLDYHMAAAAIRGSQGVVVHSDFSRGQLAAFAGCPVARIPFPAPPLATAATQWSLPLAAAGSRPVQLFTFGMINGNKQVKMVIEVIASSRFLRDHVRYVVLGQVDPPGELAALEGLIESCQLEDVVGLLGPQPDGQLHQALRSADVVINLRKPHLGESSWSLLESLFAGKPTVVWNHGSYAEFPEGVVRKVASRTRLVEVLEELVRSAELRRQIGRQARDYAMRTFDTSAYCRELLSFAGFVAGQRPVLRLTDTVARLLQEMAPWPESHRLAERVGGEIGALLDEPEPGL